MSWIGWLLQLSENIATGLLLGAWWHYVSVGFDPVKLYWFYMVLVITWMAVLIIEMCCEKVNDSTCAQLFFINLFKGLTLLSAGLMIAKTSHDYSNWNNTIIPLWIVCVMSLAMLLMLVILFVNVMFNLIKKLCVAERISAEPEMSLFILTLWLLANWSGLSIIGLMFLLRFKKTLVDLDPLENSSSLPLFSAIYWSIVWIYTIALKEKIS